MKNWDQVTWLVQDSFASKFQLLNPAFDLPISKVGSNVLTVPGYCSEKCQMSTQLYQSIPFIYDMQILIITIYFAT
jgi:hypothetical protein